MESLSPSIREFFPIRKGSNEFFSNIKISDDGINHTIEISDITPAQAGELSCQVGSGEIWSTTVRQRGREYAVFSVFIFEYSAV